MRLPRLRKKMLLNAFVLLFPAIVFAQTIAVKSQWVYMNGDNKLHYKTTEKGDRIMDFSHAGYMGGGVAIPAVPVKIIRITYLKSYST